ncbi:MAG: response regulator [Rubrivivax sp.]
MDPSLPDSSPAGRALPASLGTDPSRLARMSGLAGIGYWSFDPGTRTGRWSPELLALHGLPADAPVPTVEQWLQRFVHPDDREPTAAALRQWRSGGADAHEQVLRIVRTDGTVRELLAHSLVEVEDDRRLRFGVVIDVSSLRHAHQALRESQARARGVARLSHELRTPLNAILGCCQILRADEAAGHDDPRQRQRLLAEVESAGHELLALVDRVLDLSSRVPAAQARVPPPPSPPPGPGRRTLLYVEDNEVNALIVRELVARRGDLHLVVAATGAEGLRLADELQPALVLLDMQLPDMDGAEVFSRLRASARTAALPCVALSANALGSDIDAALAAGMTAYWTKPLDFRAFTQWLDGLFGPAAAPAP